MTNAWHKQAPKRPLEPELYDRFDEEGEKERDKEKES